MQFMGGRVAELVDEGVACFVGCGDRDADEDALDQEEGKAEYEGVEPEVFGAALGSGGVGGGGVGAIGGEEFKGVACWG